MDDLRDCTWPIGRLTAGLEALAGAAGLDPRRSLHAPPAHRPDNANDLIGAIARDRGLKAAHINCKVSELRDFFRLSAPSIIRLPESQGGEFLLVVGSTRSVVWVLGQDLARHRVQPRRLLEVLSGSADSPPTESISHVLEHAGLDRRRSTRPLEVILRQQRGEKYTGLWTLRRPINSSVWSLVRQYGLGAHLAGFLICYLAQYGLLLSSWWLIGAAALRGFVDFGWLQAWGLLLLTRIPLIALASWYQGLVATRAGSLFKQRLLEGTFHLSPEEVGREGVGHTLSRVMESESLETLALGGGFLALVAGMELLAAASVLALGAGGAVNTLALAAWMAVACFGAIGFWKHRRRWTTSRLALTHRSTELMIGHRTRLAQRSGAGEGEADDRAIAEYLEVSEAMDRSAARLQALIPRGWLLLGTVLIAPHFIGGTNGTLGLAVAIAGILLAYRAFERVVAGLTLIVDAIVAWRETAVLFKAGGQVEWGASSFSIAATAMSDVTSSAPREAGTQLLEAHEVEFTYPGGARPVIRDCSFRIDTGDRVLVESASGAGVSALVSLIAGLRRGNAGVLLVDGLDRDTMGRDQWAELVAAAAQQHENHVFTHTLAFNLLMGRRWPPEPQDLKEAKEVCEELGLGPMLNRMPSALHQVVGDTGWQLSQGERARVFIGRALLQRSQLVVVDANLASLDAGALRQVLICVSKRAPSILMTSLSGDATDECFANAP